jgi:hypothetical protein
MTASTIAVLLLVTLQGAPATAPPADRLTRCRALAHSVAPITVRGRLYAANGGGSGFRIWVAGTHRIVWVTPKIEPAVPDAIRSAFKPFDEVLVGDFTLVPLSPDRPGVMREVCFVSGAHRVSRLQTDRQ